ncbi:hypothetical protein [Legionella erythra]|nr:hypothetical protein [Legionella erythra]
MGTSHITSQTKPETDAGWLTKATPSRLPFSSHDYALYHIHSPAF